MANIGLKHGIYHVRFRFGGKEYKKSLKTGEKSAAEAAKASVELTIHRLLTGLLQLSPDVDPGDFILSGGTRTQPVNPAPKVIVPSIIKLRDDYLVSQRASWRSPTMTATRSIFAT